MSKLDIGRHTVWAIPHEETLDEYEAPVWTEGEPVKVPCIVQVMSSEEQMQLGLQANTVYQIMVRAWPWNMHTEVIWEGFDGEWPNRRWTQQGDPKRYGTGYFTKHVVVTIKAKDAE